MKNMIAYLVILLVFVSNTSHAQGNKIEKYVLELLPEKIAENSYDDLFWSKCLGAADKLSSKEIGAKISALINDEPSRVAFYKRVNYYLTGYEPLYSYFNIYKDVAMTAALKKELREKDLLGNSDKDSKSLFNKEDRNAYVKYIIAFGTGDFDKCATEGNAYEKTDVAPTYNGGDMALLKFLASNLVYPQLEKDNDIQGKVILEFVVCEDGSVSDVRLKQEVSPGLDAEAIRVVRMLPKFEPAKQNGVAVKCKFSLPIKFKLQ